MRLGPRRKLLLLQLGLRIGRLMQRIYTVQHARYRHRGPSRMHHISDHLRQLSGRRMLRGWSGVYPSQRVELLRFRHGQLTNGVCGVRTYIGRAVDGCKSGNRRRSRRPRSHRPRRIVLVLPRPSTAPKYIPGRLRHRIREARWVQNRLGASWASLDGGSPQHKSLGLFRACCGCGPVYG